MSQATTAAPSSPSRPNSSANTRRGQGHWPISAMLASSMSTIATGTADCGGRGMQRLQLVEHLEPERLDDRRIEEVEGDEQQDEQGADQARRQVDATERDPGLDRPNFRLAQSV